MSDRGSGVDPSTLLAQVDGSYRRLVWDKAHGLVGVRIPTLAPGSHKLVFTVSDYQEAKNNENDERDAAEHAHAHDELRGSLVPAVVVLDRRQLVEVALDARGELVRVAVQDPQLRLALGPVALAPAPRGRAAR